MHSKSNTDYHIHYNGDFSEVRYVHNITNEEKIIPPGVFSLLYAAIAEDILAKMDDAASDAIWEQARMGARLESLKEKENDI